MTTVSPITVSPAKNPFSLVAPCAKCPFRTDVEPYIRAERAKEIADALRRNGDFTCHNTIEHDDEGEAVKDERSKFCAGAAITLEKEGYSNEYLRMAERLGMYDHTRLQMDSPVYGSLAEWVKSYRTVRTVEVPDGEGGVEVLEFEHCGVVGPECEDPAGFSLGGGVTVNDVEPTCDPTLNCNACGSVPCEYW